MAWVWGIWMERGRPARAVARTRLVMPGMASLGRVAELACDSEIDDSGPEIEAPTLIVEGADLIAV